MFAIIIIVYSIVLGCWALKIIREECGSRKPVNYPQVIELGNNPKYSPTGTNWKLKDK